MSFHVGQKVVCVDASVNGRGDKPALVEGNIYTIAHIVTVNDKVGFNLIEAQIPKPLRIFYPAYRATRFRPVIERKTDISVFTALLNPANHKHLEDVR